MRPSRRPCIYALSGAFICMLLAPLAHAETLKITSDPPGATVEIDGLPAGITPYETNLPGGYFHKTHTAFNTRLEHALVARVSKEGYVAQQVTLTSGPLEWIAVTGRRRGNYFLLKSDTFHITLQRHEHADENEALQSVQSAGPIRPVFTGTSSGADSSPAHKAGALSITSGLPGSEIYIDGKFVGQTPSTVLLDAGMHRIEVKAPGKKSWERDLDVLAGSQITLHATFAEPQ
jgi:hypothetical protein